MSRPRLPENEGLPFGVSRVRYKYKKKTTYHRPFSAQCRINGKQRYLGQFATVERAAEAVQTAREFAKSPTRW